MLIFIYFFSFFGFLSANTNEKVNIIYENSKNAVIDVTSIDGNIRLLSLSHQKDMAHGMISLDYPEHVIFEYMKVILGALLIEPSPKNILIIGMGIGVLPRALDHILKNASIDVVEIDYEIVDIAKKYFLFFPSEKVKIHIQDGFDYVMSLPNKQKYDLIVMDAFETICIPDIFLNQNFVSKLKNQLSENGLISVNTLTECSKHNEELSLYMNVFEDRYFLSERIAINKILLCFNGRMPLIEEIKKNAKLLESVFSSINIDTQWLIDNSFGS
jgi:spermidine synthase